MTSKILNNTPHVEVFDNFLSKEEIQSMGLDQLHFEKSLVSTFHTKNPGRDSYSFNDKDNKFDFISHRLTELLKKYHPTLQTSFLESVQITKYEVGNFYKSHHDFTNVSKEQFMLTEHDRCASIIIYLNDDFEGGETYFPDLKLNVKPQAGSALYFRYDYDNYVTKLRTLHSSEPVLTGTKYVASIWIRNKDFRKN